MSNNNIIEISIVIDDNNTLTFKVNINESDENYIFKLCDELSNKYKLSETIKKKLVIQLSNEIKKIKDNINGKKIKKDISKSKTEIFNKLYYQDLNKKKEKELLQEQIKLQRIEEEMKNYSFTPQINNNYKFKSSNYNQQPIGDKLYSQRKKKFGVNNNKLHRVINNNINYNNKIEADFKLDLANFYSDNINSNEEKNLSRNSSNNKKNNPIYNPNYNNKERVFSANLKMKNNNKNNNESNYNNNKYRNNLLKDYQKQIITNKNKSQTNRSTVENNNNSFNKRNERTLVKGKISKSAKKLREYNFEYKINYFEKLHNDKKKYEKKQNEKTEEYYNKNYTFEPKISKGSKILMSNRNESQEQFYNRLSSTKKISTLKNYVNNIYKNPQIENNNYIINDNNNRLKTSHTNITEKLNNNLTLSCVYLDKKNNIQLKTEQNMIKNLEDIEKEKKFKEDFFKNKINSNIENYKLNEIKNIYDILNENEINFNILFQKGIPKHIINKVIKPTCYMINDKQLEFNFQNFYLISKELLDKFFN